MRSSKHVFTVSGEIDFSNHPLPVREMLESILSRAIYDLTPETSIENRRDSIRWFEACEKDDVKDAEVTSWQRVKSELNLGVKFTRIVEEVLSDAKSFQRYALDCKTLEIKPDISHWVASRKEYRTLNKKRGMPTIAFRKSSYTEADA